MDVKPAALPPPGLLEAIAAIAPKDITGRMVPEGIEVVYDERETIAWAKTVCEAEVALNGVVVIGNRTDKRVFDLIGDLRDGYKPGKSISIERMPSVLHDFWDATIGYDEWFEAKLNEDNAGRFQNEPGCGPAIYIREASEAHAGIIGGLLAAEEQARLLREWEERYYPTLKQEMPEDGWLDITREPPPRVDLVPHFLEAGMFTPIIGPGGAARTMFVMQTGAGSIFNRQLWGYPSPTRASPVTQIDYAPMGGIGSHHYVMLAYEENGKEGRVLRRLAGLRPHYGVSEAEWTERLRVRLSEQPIIRAYRSRDNKKVTEYTEFGKRLVDFLLPFADQGHWVMHWDSFFDAVDMDMASRIDDSHARDVIRTVMRLCAELNCTLLSPLHPSRAGKVRKDSGYSDAFESKVQQSISIYPKMEGTKKVRGIYTLDELKWNSRLPTDSPLPIDFRFERNQLITAVVAHETQHEPAQFEAGYSPESMASQVRH